MGPGSWVPGPGSWVPAHSLVITKCDKKLLECAMTGITKCDRCYKVWQSLQSATGSHYQVRYVLQSATSITKCDRKLLQGVTGITNCDKTFLQSATGITKCDNYYQVRLNTISKIYDRPFLRT